MWSTLIYDFHVPTSSAQSVNSSGLSLTITSGYPSDPFGFRTFKCLQALVQVSHVKSTRVFGLCEISQPVRETFPALLTEVRRDVLCEAISIFLLVRLPVVLFSTNRTPPMCMFFSLRPTKRSLPTGN